MTGSQFYWLQPNLAWAIDAAERSDNPGDHHLYHIVVQDLATTFQFEPRVEESLTGYDAAHFLRHRFVQHGAPSFHRHNCLPRRLLDGQSATQAYFQRPPPVRWTRREHHQIFAWIGALAKRMLRAMDAPGRRHLRRAWRRAVESWLRRQGLIVVSINQQPITRFSPRKWASTVLLHNAGAHRKGPTLGGVATGIPAIHGLPDLLDYPIGRYPSGDWGFDALLFAPR